MITDCKESILKMLRKSQTKVIFPIITLALIMEYNRKRKIHFSDSEIRDLYHGTVRFLQTYLSHNLHIGGKYYDAYPFRNLPKYGVLKVNGKSFELTKPFRREALELEHWIPIQIKDYIQNKIGVIPQLHDIKFRAILASDDSAFTVFITENISRNPTNFEIFSFAIIKSHLEKFSCKVYRDTRTSAIDRGVDLSTNFGVVYQIKKLKLDSIEDAKQVYAEIKVNFDEERMNDGKVVIVIDDISKKVKSYLIDMKVQTISKAEVVKLLTQFDEHEDRMKVLRIIYDEFRRDYESQIN